MYNYRKVHCVMYTHFENLEECMCVCIFVPIDWLKCLGLQWTHTHTPYMHISGSGGEGSFLSPPTPVDLLPPHPFQLELILLCYVYAPQFAMACMQPLVTMQYQISALPPLPPSSVEGSFPSGEVISKCSTACVVKMFHVDVASIHTVLNGQLTNSCHLTWRPGYPY